MTVSTYLIKKNSVTKKVEVAVGDRMTLVEAENFAKEFLATVASINASQYQLVIDSTNMQVLSPQLAKELEGAMLLYKQAGFSKVIVKIQDNVTLRMQVKRVAREAGLLNLEISTT